MHITLLAAASENNAIGKDNALLWRLPLDFERMKQLTMGKPLIMGRKTHESIGRALPGRQNIVVTHREVQFPGCDTVHSLAEALALAQKSGADEAFIFGGGEIYREAMPLADRIELTRVEGEFEGDAFFPDINSSEWELLHEERHEKDDKHAHAFRFLTYQRKS